MSDSNGSFSKTVFWTLILGSFAFTAGCYMFSYAGQGRTISITTQIAEKLSDAIVTNDRLRQQDKDALSAKVDSTNQLFNGKLDKIEQDLTEVKVTIAKCVK